jgi:hypothetical protein
LKTITKLGLYYYYYIINDKQFIKNKINEIK